MEENTTKDVVRAAFKRVVDEDHAVAGEVKKSLRMVYGLTQITFVGVPAEVTQKAIGDKDKIHVGLENCTIREVTNRFTMCYKCWHTRHLA